MSIKLLQALQDCVSVMANDLKGMAIIQPELEQAQKALADHFRPVEWDGLGMPQDGAECEMRRLDYVDVDWQKIKFLCAGEKKAFFVDSEGHEWSRPLSEIKFRPIRTAEQVAAEERKTEILEMIDTFGTNTAIWGRDAVMEICGHLWEAGYRKQVAP